MSKLTTIIWDDHVSIPDAAVDAFARDAVKAGLTEIRVGTATMLNALRLEVKRGNLDPQNVAILFRDQQLHIDKYGELDHWPIGFGDKWDQQLGELIGWDEPKE